MKFGPSRGHFISIFEGFFKNFGLLIFALTVSFFSHSLEVQEIIIYSIALISPVFKALDFMTRFYSVDEKKLTVKHGIFKKEITEIPIANITTIDYSQNILQQIFRVYKLKIDNSARTNDGAAGAEASMILKDKDAFYVRELIMSLKEGKEQEEEELPFLEVESSSFFLRGIFQSKLGYFFAVVAFIGTAFNYIDDIFKVKIPEIPLAYTIGFVSAAAVIVVFIVSILDAVIRYYGFSLRFNSDSIIVKFGLFKKKSYTLIKEKISGFEIRQSPLMRLSGYCNIDIYVIGYGDSDKEDKQEKAILHPLIKKNQAYTFINSVMPEFVLVNTYEEPNKKALPYFFLCFRMFLGVLLLGVSVVYGNIYFILGSIAFLILMIISVFAEYKQIGIYFNEKTLSLKKGIFSLSQKYIPVEKIEAVKEVASTRKRKKGITDIHIHFISPIRVGNLKARNMKMEQFIRIKNILEY